MILSAKVTFSKIGLHTCEGKAGNLFIPRVAIQIEGRKSAKTGYIQFSRFDKKDYQGLAILPDFIVIVTKQEYITVGEDAEERKSISRAEAGEIEPEGTRNVSREVKHYNLQIIIAVGFKVNNERTIPFKDG